jgi:prepilin-type processing-associated H-X9-DG protein
MFTAEELAPLNPIRLPWSKAAVLSFVFTVCTVFGLWMLNFAILACLPAILLGGIGRDATSGEKPRLRGRGIATLSILLGFLAIPAGLVLTLLDSFRAADHKHDCTNNLKMIGLAFHNYHDAYGCFPPAAILDRAGRPLLSWRVALLPFMEEDSLFRRFHLDEPWDSPHNIKLVPEIPRWYRCEPYGETPAPLGETSYHVVVGPKTMFTGGPAGVSLNEVTDGTSRTLMIVERTLPAPWSAPYDLCFTAASTLTGWDSHHPGGFNAAFADGSCRFITTAGPRRIGTAAFWRLLTRDGGEAMGDARY